MENRKLRKDNQKLAAENERLRFEIAALNSALRSKNYASPRMAGAMDWSSVDLGN
jgi:cell division protein FtsB